MRRLQLRSRILAVALLTTAVILVPTRTQAQTLTGIVTDSPDGHFARPSSWWAKGLPAPARIQWAGTRFDCHAEAAFR